MHAESLQVCLSYHQAGGVALSPQDTTLPGRPFLIGPSVAGEDDGPMTGTP